MNIFRQLFVSLYSPKDIASFRNQRIGKTILFLFFLTLVSVLPSSYYVNTMIKHGISTMAEMVANELPPFEIKNGTLTAEGDKPTILNKNGFTIFIDDTNTLTKEDIKNRADNGLALLKSELVMVSAGSVQSSPYTFIEADNQTISKWLEHAQGLLWIFLTIMNLIFYLFSAFFMFFKVFIFAWFGMVVNSAFKKQLKYGQLWNLTAYCLTLPTIFFTIMDIFEAAVPFRLSIHWFVILILLMLTIKEVPQETSHTS